MTDHTNTKIDTAIPAQPELLTDNELDNASGGTIFRVKLTDEPVVVDKEAALDRYIRRHTK